MGYINEKAVGTFPLRCLQHHLPRIFLLQQALQRFRFHLLIGVAILHQIIWRTRHGIYDGIRYVALVAVFIASMVSAGYILKKERLVEFSVPFFSDVIHTGSAQVS